MFQGILVIIFPFYVVSGPDCPKVTKSVGGRELDYLCKLFFHFKLTLFNVKAINILKQLIVYIAWLFKDTLVP